MTALAAFARTGLIGGLVIGMAQGACLAWGYRSDMGWRLWADILSYAGAVHGLLWGAYGAAVGLAWGVIAAVSRRAYERVLPGAFAFGLVVAGISAFVLWSMAAASGFSLAVGLQLAWCVIMTAYWLVTGALGYLAACYLTKSRFGRHASRLGRYASGPALAILLICLAIQWVERPRLMAATTRWKDAGYCMPPARDPRPNVLFVVLDTLRADRLGCYGYTRPTTPRLDAFAKDALVFETCVSPAVWTLPSHASMFTGLFPSEHGADHGHTWLDDEFVTMAERLKQAGYQTGIISNNLWVSSRFNMTQGFEFEQHTPPWALYRPRGNSVSQFAYRVLHPAGALGKWLGAIVSEDSGAKYTNQFAAKWLDGRDRQRPFFLFINYLEPHDPYRPHLPHREVFMDADDVDLSYRRYANKDVQFSLLKRDCCSSSELRMMSDLYDGEVRMLDDYVGELLELFAERAPLNDTLVIIAADHGENLGEHHMMSHHSCAYDTLCHVPLIIRYPKRVQPGRTARLVQLTDLLPTVIDAANGRPLPTSSTFGRSLLPPPETIPPSEAAQDAGSDDPAGPRPSDRPAVVELMSPWHDGLDQAQLADRSFNREPYEKVLRAIRLGPWKYTLAEDGRKELYNLSEDPCETDNRVMRDRAVADDLDRQLGQWLERRRAYTGDASSKGQRRLDDDTRNRLRDLGYLQ
ncbi:MAG: sulfatase-like hydrolase/transferase [Phycisphaerae bacterium]|nr:sulfatase-like hydrolase/transferase [Phycisphaerae bacterium]